VARFARSLLFPLGLASSKRRFDPTVRWRIASLRSLLFFVDLRRSDELEAVSGSSKLFRFAMRDVLAAETAVLAQLEPLARLLLVFGRAVIPALTLGARQRDDVSHW
jgi:hypothetical protein